MRRSTLLKLGAPATDKFRMLRAALISALLISPLAKAEPAMLMVNMNYSSEELKALREVAKKRGQKVYIVPPEAMIPTAEPLFKLRISTEAKIKKMRPQFTKSQLAASIADFQRKGAASERDPELSRALFQEVEELHRETLELADKETKLGSLEAQVKAMAAKIKSNGDTVDTMVMSGHSDGANLSGESTLRLSATDIDRIQQSNPEIFSKPRHVLLLGCYNLTDTARGRWRFNLFPNASLVAGFGVQAPSRWRESAIKYIGDTLNTADSLDDQMLAKDGPLDPGLITRAFRKLASVTNTQSVIDYCLTLVEGQPGNARIPCDEQWDSFMHQSKLITKEFLDLNTLQSDPPEDVNGGSLRTYLNQLQLTCPASENPNIPPKEKAEAERYRASIKESITRLIFWANVQVNFSTYFEKDIEDTASMFRKMGIPFRMPVLDGTTGRMEFLKSYNAMEKSLEDMRDDIAAQQRRLASKDRMSSADYDLRRELARRDQFVRETYRSFSDLYESIYLLRGDTTVGDGDQNGVESTLRRGGIPFSWIESGTVLKPRAAK